MRNFIVIHHSESSWGSASVIDKWHRERGFNRIGYHFVISNGYLTADHWRKKVKDDLFDGMLEVGRPLDSDSVLESSEIGAGVRGWNSQTLHICLIGIKEFTVKQLERLEEVLLSLQKKFNIMPKDIRGHYEFDNKKDCPGFSVEFLRNYLMVKDKLISMSFSP